MDVCRKIQTFPYREIDDPQEPMKIQSVRRVFLVKKWSVLILSAILLMMFGVASAEALQPGDVVYLGAYEQDNNQDNGAEPIGWTVLAAEEDRALLVSQYALDCQPFHQEKDDTTWEDSTIRTWLNGTFLTEAFTEQEQMAVQTTNVDNQATQGNLDWKRVNGYTTQDKLFLLSYREVEIYMTDKNARKATGTEYAKNAGAKLFGITTIGIGETDWWLRSPGSADSDSCFVDVGGNFKSKSMTDKVGIRPAMWLDLTVDRTYFPYEQYAAAILADEEGRYGDAAAIFEALGTYNGSEAKANSSSYQQAVAAMNDGDATTALRLFEALGNYEDSYANGRACRYALAVAAQESGDYETAATLFGKAGQYEDSMARLKTCFDKMGVSVYYFSAETVDAGVDTGYAQTNVITGKNKHFGWELGRFFMSGFTRVSDKDGQAPVFIKTLGDSVTLWFNLEQNIDALNGNKEMTIGEDTNGYDQSFGVSRTNFGRGTLIVRHTDYQNKKGEPQIYTDYLLAKGTSGADTKIVFNEEGDYEVALDYEVQDSNFAHIISKFGNYRILLKFSVRNGNCMVYPFDALTGAELQNTAVTENGFYLDLARSRYLDIDVKRSVIVEGPAGMIEDERFNRPAKDGDQYTAEGIYTISVSNRYTGESTVKTIFVGSDELLQQYIANGFSIDRLK